MIVDKYKSDSTLIQIDDRDIGTKEENRDVANILISLIMKKVSEYTKKDL